MLRALGLQSAKSDSQAEGETPEITDDQPRNSYTELQLLDRHTDIVRHLARIDNSRFVSTGDDGSVIIWEIETGRAMRVIKQNKSPWPVTCILLLPSITTLLSSTEESESFGPSGANEAIQAQPPPTAVPDWLITASANKTIQMWNLNADKPHRTLQAPGAVKCLVALFEGSMFCSAGHSISVWSNDGNLIYDCPRPKADSYIHTVVPIRGNRLVVASDRPALSVYNVEQPSSQPSKLKVAFFRVLQSHRESIHCLVAVSDAMLASSSLDGMVVLWSTLSLNPMRKFNEHENFRDQLHSFPYCVNHLVALEGRYLLAAIGNGFCMYDAIIAQYVVKCTNAHVANINHMSFVSGGSMLATCSEDGVIRLWSISSSDTAEEAPKLIGPASPVETFMGEKKLVSHRKVAKPIVPALVGQLTGHSGAVQRLLDLSPDGFASCSSDRMVILWKHGSNESQKRDEAVRAYLGTECDCSSEHIGSPRSVKSFDSSIF